MNSLDLTRDISAEQEEPKDLGMLLNLHVNMPLLFIYSMSSIVMLLLCVVNCLAIYVMHHSNKHIFKMWNYAILVIPWLDYYIATFRLLLVSNVQALGSFSSVFLCNNNLSLLFPMQCCISLSYQRWMNKEAWQRKNTTAVISVENTSLPSLHWKHTREFTLERNPMDVISVDNTSLECHTLKHTREFTLERNPMDVISVRNTSLDCPTLKNTRKFTLEIYPNNCVCNSW